jgi:hypothetical protein
MVNCTSCCVFVVRIKDNKGWLISKTQFKGWNGLLDKGTNAPLIVVLICFSLMPMDDERVFMSLFYMHLYIFFEEKSIQILCSLCNWIINHFVISVLCVIWDSLLEKRFTNPPCPFFMWHPEWSFKNVNQTAIFCLKTSIIVFNLDRIRASYLGFTGSYYFQTFVTISLHAICSWHTVAFLVLKYVNSFSFGPYIYCYFCLKISPPLY